MSPAADLPETPPKVLVKSMYSFKVLTECPIMVVLLFQSYQGYAAANIMKFIPLIFQVHSLIISRLTHTLFPPDAQPPGKAPS